MSFGEMTILTRPGMQDSHEGVLSEGFSGDHQQETLRSVVERVSFEAAHGIFNLCSTTLRTAHLLMGRLRDESPPAHFVC